MVQMEGLSILTDDNPLITSMPTNKVTFVDSRDLSWEPLKNFSLLIIGALMVAMSSLALLLLLIFWIADKGRNK